MKGHPSDYPGNERNQPTREALKGPTLPKGERSVLDLACSWSHRFLPEFSPGSFFNGFDQDLDHSGTVSINGSFRGRFNPPILRESRPVVAANSPVPPPRFGLCLKPSLLGTPERRHCRRSRRCRDQSPIRPSAAPHRRTSETATNRGSIRAMHSRIDATLGHDAASKCRRCAGHLWARPPIACLKYQGLRASLRDAHPLAKYGRPIRGVHLELM